MRLATLLALAVGLLLFCLLLVSYGIVPIASAVTAAGWGLLWVALYRFVTITTDAAGWRALFPAHIRPSWGPLIHIRWIGESINTLLPVAQVGGDVARARLASRLGLSGAEAGATVLVDFTLGLATQLLYTLIGAGLLVQMSGATSQERSFASALYGGLLVAALVVAVFYLVQRRELFQTLAKILQALARGREWVRLTGGAADLDQNVARIYNRRGDVLVCAAWRFFTWILHSGETWLALYFLGAPVSFAKAIVLESLSTAVRSAAFVIPGGLGAQEGGFLLLGHQLGFTAEMSLALALVKRVRELLVGGPGLIAWTAAEGRSLARLLSNRP